MGKVTELRPRREGSVHTEPLGRTAHVNSVRPDATDVPHMNDLGVGFMTIDFQPGNGTRYSLAIGRVEQHGDFGGRWMISYGIDHSSGGAGGGRCSVIASEPEYGIDWIAAQLHCRLVDAAAIAPAINRAIAEGTTLVFR